MICVYAIIDGALPDDVNVAALGDQPLEYPNCGRVCAALTRHSGAPQPTPENVLRYERAIECLMDKTTVLPVRFGTCFRSQESARAAIAQHEDALVAALERVRDRVEMGVRLVALADDPAFAQAALTPTDRVCISGKQYMLAKLAEQRQRDRAQEQRVRLAQEVLEPLTARWPHIVQKSEQGASLQSFAYLVPKREVAQFRTQLQNASLDHPQIRFLCTGPWPPHNFTPDLTHAERQ
jgi:hypothetical protein